VLRGHLQAQVVDRPREFDHRRCGAEKVVVVRTSTTTCPGSRVRRTYTRGARAATAPNGSISLHVEWTMPGYEPGAPGTTSAAMIVKGVR
jgi:hypothetical protein